MGVLPVQLLLVTVLKTMMVRNFVPGSWMRDLLGLIGSFPVAVSVFVLVVFFVVACIRRFVRDCCRLLHFVTRALLFSICVVLAVCVFGLSLVCLVGLLVCVVLLGFGFAFSSWRSPLFKVCMLILSHPGFDDATALSIASFDSVIGSCLSLQFESLHIPQKGNRQHVNSSTPVALDSLGMSEPPSRNALRMVILGIFLVAAFFN